MTAARYWRAVGIDTYGGDLELSALHLYSLADPDYPSVTFLLAGEGSDGSQTFVDHSSAPLSLTPAGQVQNSTVQQKFGNPSLAFDGGGDFIIGPKTTALAFGTGDFTVESWVHPTVRPVGEHIVVSGRDASSGIFDGVFRLSTTGKFGMSQGAGWLETTNTVPLNQWVHVAASRNSGVLRMYVNGVLGYENNLSLDMAGARILHVGAYEAYGGNAAGGFFQGYMDQLRITKGFGRYPAAFTPPSAPFAHSAAAAVRQDASATISASLAPLFGVLGNLQDDDTSTVARLRNRESGFSVMWDFGPSGDATVNSVRVGSSTNRLNFPTRLDLQYSNDGATWTTELQLAAPTWPGPNAMAPLGSFGPTPLSTVGVRPEVFAESAVDNTLGQGINLVTWRDMYFDGDGFISGTVKRDADPVDIPLKRRVRLHREHDGLPVRETWSDPVTGAYSFPQISRDFVYTVVAYDYEHNYRAVIADNIVPEVMT